MESIWIDLKRALRCNRERPGFSMAVICIMALGIGATASALTLVDSVLLAPAPYKLIDRLVIVRGNDRGENPERRVSFPDFEDWRRQARSFDGMAATGGVRLVLNDPGHETESVTGEYVSSDYFGLFGVAPLIGRVFAPEEVVAEGDPQRLIVLSEGLWRRRFGGDVSVIGKTVSTTDGPFEVIGVMPVSFGGLNDMVCQICDDVRFWLPSSASQIMYHGWIEDRRRRWHNVFGSLRSGVTLDEARAELDLVTARLAEQYPESNENVSALASPLSDLWRDGARSGLTILLIASLFVWLIGCVNVAALMMARAQARRREFAVRQALGAGNGRLVRMLAAEGLLLTLSGGAAGCLLAVWWTQSIVALGGSTLPGFVRFNMGFGAAALVATLSIVSGIAFALVPLIETRGANVSDALKGSRQRRSSLNRQSLLVVTQVALALVLLTGAVSLTRSFIKLTSADPGFQASNMLLMEINPNSPRYRQAETQRQFIAELQERLALVREAAAITIAAPNLPPRTFVSQDIHPDPPLPGSEALRVEVHRVASNFFRVTGIPILAGRSLTREDNVRSVPVVVVSDSVGRRLWPDESPIEKRIRGAGGTVFTVVGVTGDVRYGGMRSARGADLDIYYSIDQVPSMYMTIAARVPGDFAPALRAIRAELSAIDADLPVLVVSSVEERFSMQSRDTQMQAAMLTGFAAAAFLLAALGVYGLVSYSVSRATRDVGIRIALGASSRTILKEVVGLGLKRVLLGAGIGLAGSLALAGAIESLLFGVAARDPWTFAGATSLLVLVTVVACFIPARRASRVDPLMVLRSESPN